jgi:hypothetical protein
MPRLGSGAHRTSRTRRTIEGSVHIWVKDVPDDGGIVIRETSMVVLAVLLLASGVDGADRGGVRRCASPPGRWRGGRDG